MNRASQFYAEADKQDLDWALEALDSSAEVRVQATETADGRRWWIYPKEAKPHDLVEVTSARSALDALEAQEQLWASKVLAPWTCDDTIRDSTLACGFGKGSQHWVTLEEDGSMGRATHAAVRSLFHDQEWNEVESAWQHLGGLIDG